MTRQLAPPSVGVDTVIASLHTIADDWPHVVWVNSPYDGRQLYVNRAWSEITGQPIEAAFQDPLSWARFVHEGDRQRVAQVFKAWVDDDYRGPLELRFRYLYADGSVRWMLNLANASRDAAGEPQFVFGIAIDMTQTEQELEEAHRVARLDPLTDLHNRRAFATELKAALSDRRGAGVALTLIDLDGFKSVNDLYGHLAGDGLLRSVAAAIRRAIRDTDVAFRLGGDEFAVLQRDATACDALATAERIAAAIRAIELADPADVIDVAASFGIAMLEPRGDLTPDEANARADAALYATKTRSRGGISVFPEEHTEAAQTMLRQPLWWRRLHEAFQYDKLDFHAQPVVSLADGTVTGFELLLRLTDGDQQFGAGDLMHHIRRLGRIRQLDRWAVERVARILDEHESLLDSRNIGINISAKSLNDPTFAQHVRSTLGPYVDDSDGLYLEITERDEIEDMAQARAIAEEIDALGIRLSLDDFGTGYGSPEVLRALPFSGIKLDRQFVSGSGTSRLDNLIARQTADLAMALGIHSVAEGVETEDVAVGMRVLGLTHAQGHFFGAPLPLEAALEAPQAWHPRTRSPKWWPSPADPRASESR